MLTSCLMRNPYNLRLQIFNAEQSNKTALVNCSDPYALLATISCKSIIERQRDVRPLVLRDVPAQRLAYRFQADVDMPSDIATEDLNDKIEAIQLEFNTKRQEDALVRTVRSPDGQRALVLYGRTDEPSQTFHIDLYSADGIFLRNLTPPTSLVSFPKPCRGLQMAISSPSSRIET